MDGSPGRSERGEPIFVYDKASLSRQIKRNKQGKLVRQTNGGFCPRKRPAVFAQLEGEADGPSEGKSLRQLNRLSTFPRDAAEQKEQPGDTSREKENWKNSLHLRFTQRPKMASSHGLCCSVAVDEGRDA